MSMNKKKSRPIVHDDISFRYVISQSTQNEDGSFNLNIIIQHAEGVGSYLKINGIYSRDYWLDLPDTVSDFTQYVSITPKHITKFIELALKQGWQPTIKGPPFKLAIDNKLL